MKLTVLAIALALQGCAVLQRDTEGSRPSLSYVFKETNGCKDKLSISRKITFKMCF